MPLISVIFFAMNILILQKSDTLLNKTICIDVHVQQATHFLICSPSFIFILLHIHFICQSVAFDLCFEDKMIMSGLKYAHNSEKNMAAIHETCNRKGEPYLCHSV